MNVPGSFTVCVMIPFTLEEKENCTQFLKILGEELPCFFPEKIGNWEPIKTPFVHIEDATNYWHSPFLWKRRKEIKCEGYFSFGYPLVHSDLIICSNSKQLPQQQNTINFLIKFCLHFFSDLAYINLCTDNDSRLFDYSIWHPLSLGLFTHCIRKGIPLLPWATVFGAPYVNLLGMDAFLDVPAHTVTPLNEQQVYIQITEHIEDIYTDYDVFARKRAQIMDYLSPLFQGSEFGVQVPPEILRPINERR